MVSDGIQDEYDQYAAKLASLIRGGATDQQLTGYLEWAEMENMGLGGPFDGTRAAKVISALRKLELPTRFLR